MKKKRSGRSYMEMSLLTTNQSSNVINPGSTAQHRSYFMMQSMGCQYRLSWNHVIRDTSEPLQVNLL